MIRFQPNYIKSFVFKLKKLSLLSVLLFLSQTVFAQFQVQTSVKESRCSANGQISLKVTGGTVPYSYQIVGSVLPPQTNDTFKLLPPAVYQIRITDAVGANMVVSATISGNYQAPTTQCAVDYSNVKMTTLGGRLPLRYAYTLVNNANYSVPQTSPNFTCLPNGTYNFRVFDSCDNFHTTTCIINVPDLVDTVSCEQVNDKINITTKGFSGGISPILFTCVTSLGDTFRNATGNFSQLTGCVFQVIMSDRCNQIKNGLTCSSLKGYVKCANFQDSTASIAATGGLPPYQFKCLNNGQTNTNGVFSRLPRNRTDYQFQVTDACGAINFFSVAKMYLFRVLGSACPFDSTMRVDMNQTVTLSDTCLNCSSFYPYRFDCLDCSPPKTAIDDVPSLVNPLRPFGNLSKQPHGTYHIVVTNGCNDTVHVTATTSPIKPSLTFRYDCPTKKIYAYTSVSGSTYILKDSLNRTLATNTTGNFDAPYNGLYFIIAAVPTCDTIRDSLRTISYIGTCYKPSSKINPATGKCEFKWILEATSQTLASYTLTGGPDSISVTNTAGVFKDVEPNSRYTLKTLCNDISFETPPPLLPNMKAALTTPCAFESDLRVQGARDTLWGCLTSKYRDQYFLFDSLGNKIDNNYTGLFPSIKLGQTYHIKAQTPEGCFIQTLPFVTAKYERPVLTASYGVLCGAGATGGNIRFILRGGIPPFDIQVTDPPNVAPSFITDKNTGVFYSLPPGNYILRAFDSCGISSDFATSVGPLAFTPQYKRACDGKFSLEVPFIDSATYTWTNRAGTTIGTNRLLELRDTTAQTYTIRVETAQNCSFSDSIQVPHFSPILVQANAGVDFVSTNTTTTLHAQALAQGITGRWRQISPSTGTTIFENINSPNTKITVSDMPGEYLYVWEITDATGVCTSSDTVFGSFCNTALVLNTNIVVTPTACKKATGKATVTVTNTTASIIYRWSNGKTGPSVDSLAAGIYTVTVSTAVSCSPPRVDTVAIKEPSAIPPRTIDTVLCVGTNFIVGTKTYTQTGNYKDTLRSVAGCDSIVNANLRFSRVPIENLGIIHQLNAKYCGDSLALNSRGDSSLLYQWFWQNVACPTCRNPNILPLSISVFPVVVTDKTTKCTAKDSVKVQIEGSFTERVPNAFTPNNDGLNDVFNVIPDNCIKIVRRLRIFNRWGNLVFDKMDLLPQKNEGWTGLNQNTPLASDVYAFIMEIEFVDSTTKKITGEVNLVR